MDLKNIHNHFFQTILDKQAFYHGKYLYVLLCHLTRLFVLGQWKEKKLFQAFIDGRQIVPSTKRGEKGMTESIAVQMARECT